MKEEARIAFIERLCSSFLLRLNDIKFKIDEPSNSFFNFSKFYGKSFLSAKIGFEETFISIRNPNNESLVFDICNRLSDIFFTKDFKSISFNIREHCKSFGDLQKYLEQFIPNCPDEFHDNLTGRGVSYTIKVEDKNLSFAITLSNSLFIDNGLFVAVDFVFEPCKFDFLKAFEIAKDQFNLILENLNLKINLE